MGRFRPSALEAHGHPISTSTARLRTPADVATFTAPNPANSNDGAWPASADRPLTGYGRIFGTVGSQRGPRTRGAIEDVAAMAARGGLTVRDLQDREFANRAPAGALAAADAATACAALPGGTATGSDGEAVDVAGACPVPASWDRTMNTDSGGALLFDRFRRMLRSSVPAAQFWKVPFSATDPVHTPNTLNTATPGFATALADTVDEPRGAGVPLGSALGGHQFVVRSGGPHPAGVLPVLEPELAPPQRPDPVVLG